MLPEKESPEVENYYKGLLTSNVLLEEAGRLAAKNRRILNRKDINYIKVVRVDWLRKLANYKEDYNISLFHVVCTVTVKNLLFLV